MNPTAPLLAWGAGHAPLGAVRLLVAGALAVCLHALLLAPGQLTLISSAVRSAPPAMVVRLLTPEAMGRASSVAPPTEPIEAVPAPIVAMATAGHGVDLGSAPSMVASGVAAKSSPAASAASLAPLPEPEPAPEPGLPAAPDYFAGGRLDPGPRPLEDVDPAYPEEAKQQEGSVVLRLLINEGGTVDNVAVVRAYPAGLFERSALEAFGRAKFSPGRMLGVAVKSQITIEVMFAPINRGKVSGRSY
jgi:TonB family protein